VWRMGWRRYWTPGHVMGKERALRHDHPANNVERIEELPTSLAIQQRIRSVLPTNLTQFFLGKTLGPAFGHVDISFIVSPARISRRRRCDHAPTDRPGRRW